MSKIGKAAGWSNFTTFVKFYNKPVHVINFDLRILNRTLLKNICFYIKIFILFCTGILIIWEIIPPSISSDHPGKYSYETSKH